MIGGGEVLPLIEAPAVAEVYRRCAERAPYLSDRPLAVDPDLWHEARRELSDILGRRGFPLAYASIDVPNFVLHGATIIMDEA